MLDQVKLALRVTSTAFNSEIQTLIDAAIAEMHGLGITAAVEDTDDAQIVLAVIAYCKWQFGGAPDADTWAVIYHEKVAQLQNMTGYTDWGDGNGSV